MTSTPSSLVPSMSSIDGGNFNPVTMRVTCIFESRDFSIPVPMIIFALSAMSFLTSSVAIFVSSIVGSAAEMFIRTPVALDRSRSRNGEAIASFTA